MNRPTDDKLERLPAWARDYIVGLEREVRGRDQLLDELTTLRGGGKSDFYVTDVRGKFSDEFSLPQYATLFARIGYGAEAVCLRVDHSNGEPVLRAHSIRGTRMIVMPEAANAIVIKAP